MLSLKAKLFDPYFAFNLQKFSRQPVYKDCEWSPYTSLLMRIHSQHLVYIFRRRFYLFHKIHQSFKLRTWMCRSVLGIYLAKEICTSERAFSCRESKWVRERDRTHFRVFHFIQKSVRSKKIPCVPLRHIARDDHGRVTRGFLVLSIELHHIPIIHDLCKEKKSISRFFGIRPFMVSSYDKRICIHTFYGSRKCFNLGV